MRPVVVVVLLVVLFAVPTAHAHPFTLEKWPGGGVNGEVGTTQIWVKYSEEVEINFSSLKVYDGAGNQIDNRDTTYHIDRASLVVTTPPLEEGIYTVASKVLSSVDGHLVPDAFVFAVGNIVLEPDDTGMEQDLVYLPEAMARFPGLVGQTILLGSAVAALFIWRTQDKRRIKDDVSAVLRIHGGKISTVLGMSLIAILASNIGVLAVQTVRFGEFTPDALYTHFGVMWIVRMVITGALLVLWFSTERRGIGRRSFVILIGLAAILLWTSSQVGHGAASGEFMPVILDYIHNWVAAIWIGGIAYLSLVLMPSLSRASGRDRILTVMLPRFSAVFIVCLGLVIITGPLLMWTLEDDLSAIYESVYGRLIMVKLALAAGMIVMGGYVQFSIVRSGGTGIYGRLRRSLSAELGMGMALLGVVALLINGTVPAGEIRAGEYVEQEGLRLAEFTENTKFQIEIEPYTTGLNGIYVTTTELDGRTSPDQSGMRIKISNPARNISPVSIDMESTETVNGIIGYYGEVTFGFAGDWVLEIESQRETGANEVVTMRLPITVNLDSLMVQTDSYRLPEPAKPLYPVYDDQIIWISDPSAPRIWKFDTQTKEFQAFGFEGGISLFLDMDPGGRIWFTDPVADNIGYLDPDTGHVTTIDVPRLEPADFENRLTFISAHDDVWITAAAKDAIIRYDSDTGEFVEFSTGLGSFPFSIADDPQGDIWFTASGGGFIGQVAADTGEIRTYAPQGGLASPEFILFTKDVMWISEHTSETLARFDPTTETFDKIPLNVPGGLPYGSATDQYGNIWIAEHVVDAVSVYNPVTGAQRMVEIPSEGSFVQFGSSDDDGNIWFVEQQTGQITRISVSDMPSAQVPVHYQPGNVPVYTEVASPLMAGGILASSLFFVKSIRDGRRLEEVIP